MILKRFEEWQEKFPESYENAYVNLSIPKLISPLIKARQIEWNPVEVIFMNFSKKISIKIEKLIFKRMKLKV